MYYFTFMEDASGGLRHLHLWFIPAEFVEQGQFLYLEETIVFFSPLVFTHNY